MYKSKNPYNLSKMMQMEQRCPVCDQNLEPEPSFYYGAMYVSYAYTVAMFVAVYVIFGRWMGWSRWPVIGALTVALFLCAPALFRLSRNTWANFFIKYDKDAAKNGAPNKWTKD